MAFVFATTPMGEAAIPPTRAIQNLNISVPWADPQTVLVESTDSSDTFHFVSDGSITFNVTSTYP